MPLSPDYVRIFARGLSEFKVRLLGNKLDLGKTSYGEICKVIEQKVLKDEQVKAITKEQQIVSGGTSEVKQVHSKKHKECKEAHVAKVKGKGTYTYVWHPRCRTAVESDKCHDSKCMHFHKEGEGVRGAMQRIPEPPKARDGECRLWKEHGKCYRGRFCMFRKAHRGPSSGPSRNDWSDRSSVRAVMDRQPTPQPNPELGSRIAALEKMMHTMSVQMGKLVDRGVERKQDF